MRQIFSTVLIWLVVMPPLLVQAQHSRNYPFQVIHSQTVVSKSLDLAISDLDYVHIDDSLTLHDGHLIIAHKSGAFFEFEGDTTLFMAELIKDPRIGMSDCSLKEHLSQLHDTRWKRKRTTSMLGATICVPESPIDIKLASKSIDLPSPQTCIRWRANGEVVQGPFIVEFRNIFDDLIGWHHTTEQWIDVDLSSYENESGLYILQVFQADDRKISSGYYGIKLSPETCGNYLRSCDFEHPVRVLEAAFLYETTYGDLEEAYRLYVEAADMSPHPIYQRLLSNFVKRHQGLVDSIEE